MNTTLFYIGVSGHQNLGGEATQHFIAQQFREILERYKQRNHDIVLYSALAKGADQLFVQVALEQNVPVEVVLPCIDYEAIFSSDADRENYTRLLRLARTCHQLSTAECSDDTFLAAGQWIVEQSDLVVLAWNGLPPLGRGGTGDVASYARFMRRPYVHIDTRNQIVKTYQDISSHTIISHPISPKQEFVVSTQQLYQGATLTVKQHRVCMPDGKEVIRDVVERPESVLILPISQNDMVLLVEEYDFAAGVWQLTLPGGKLELNSLHKPDEQAQKELRQEIGYKANKLEKLTSFFSHPGYILHKVHAFLAQDLEWDPLEMEAQEEIKMHTCTLKEALAATSVDYRCDPEAALILWLYAQKKVGS